MSGYFSKRSASMKRIVNELSRLSRGKRACTVLVLCGTTAIAIPAQTFTPLYSFDDGTNGGSPVGLVQGTDGDFYGTTSGGAGNAGAVFKITLGGKLTTAVQRGGTGCGALLAHDAAVDAAFAVRRTRGVAGRIFGPAGPLVTARSGLVAWEAVLFPYRRTVDQPGLRCRTAARGRHLGSGVRGGDDR